MFEKYEIKGTIEVMTGLHIGTSGEFSAIGAIDSPVVRDAISGFPYIPGSSLKGKMRSLLAKAHNKQIVKDRDEDDEKITRLFGKSSRNNQSCAANSRIIVRDADLINAEELEGYGVPSFTEAKMENSINPLSAVANPRQIERVVRGAKFQLEIVYNAGDDATFEEDMEMLSQGLQLLQHDYLGGHGSRGYGRIRLTNIEVNRVIGNGGDKKDRCMEILKKARL